MIEIKEEGKRWKLKTGERGAIIRSYQTALSALHAAVFHARTHGGGQIIIKKANGEIMEREVKILNTVVTRL